MEGNLLSIEMKKFHVHWVNGCEHIGGALYDTFACFRHCHRRARGQEDILVAGREGKVLEVVSLYQHNLLVAEPHLSSGIAGDVHSTKEDSALICASWITARRSHQLILNILMVMLFDYIIHTVAVNQQVLLLKQKKTRKWVIRAKEGN